MSILMTGLKWKFGFGKHDFPVILHLLNGKSSFFSAKLNARNCITITNSSGEKKEILISKIYNKIDNSIVSEHSILLDNKRPLIELVEGKGGNISPVDIALGTNPSLEDKELNNLCLSYLSLGKDLERRRHTGLAMGEKASLALTIILLVGIIGAIYVGMVNTELLNGLAESGIKCAAAASSIVPAGGA